MGTWISSTLAGVAMHVVNQSSMIGASVVLEDRPKVITNLYETDDSLTKSKFWAMLGVNESAEEALLSFVAVNEMLPSNVEVGSPRYSNVASV
jgi:hypothetical protein